MVICSGYYVLYFNLLAPFRGIALGHFKMGIMLGFKGSSTLSYDL